MVEIQSLTKEVILQYCNQNGKEFDEKSYGAFVTDINNQQVKDDIGRMKNYCNITGSINAEVFKKNLAKCVKSSMNVYKELEGVIFNRE